ncbi:MAG: hypothetical protein GWO11_06890 [Desulfuromonadales bacterium]|nr:hypothetical protein [Desulfuromonadales bacterium]NIR34071.1 hypothetical protein [Desulfuromonadales bacterium]NIS40170.1 hypothetical protein [Desulfuromonadales bacterium]
MSSRHDDSDGSNIFWPGYVDATTNLALNLLFLLTIMITAVFMFALEMGRIGVVEADKPEKQEAGVVEKTPVEPVDEIIRLKLEIQRLNKMLAQQQAQNAKPGGLEKTVDVSRSEPKPLEGLEKEEKRDFEIVVRFKDESIAFSAKERERLLESLKPVVARGESNIYVEVPAGFSEAKRMGFYRAMAVRNLLLELEMPKENINVSVVEGQDKANASLVMVR